jgi:hypothetical protein
MSTPTNADLYVGAGNVLIDRWVNGVKTGNWRHMGLVDKLDITMSTESVKKKNAMDGARGTYKEIVTGSEATLSLSFAEFNAENLALALGGNVTTWTQASGTASDTALGNVKKGFGLSTGKNKITVTAVKKGATTLVDAGTSNGTGDYWVEKQSGTIFFLDTPTTAGLADGDAVTWTGSYLAITGKPQVNGLAAGQIQCSLKFVSASNQASGPQFEVLIPQATISGDGALSLINEDIGSGTLKGTAQQDTSQAAGEQFYRKRWLA